MNPCIIGKINFCFKIINSQLWKRSIGMNNCPAASFLTAQHYRRRPTVAVQNRTIFVYNSFRLKVIFDEAIWKNITNTYTNLPVIINGLFIPISTYFTKWSFAKVPKNSTCAPNWANTVVLFDALPPLAHIWFIHLQGK